MAPHAHPVDAALGSPELLESPLLRAAGFRHGFFTRRGGVSAPPFDALSFTAAGTPPAALEENLRRAAVALGVSAQQLYFLTQVHGVACRVLGGEEARGAVLTEEGDVTLSARPGVACAVRTADCVPVLLADPTTGAVAAIHSGWRGTVANVVLAGVEALVALSGSPATHFVAAVGPHIESCCFEVDDAVADALAAASSAGRTVIVSGDKPHVDLRAVVSAQLSDAGLPLSSVDHVPGCTVCDAARFFSFRRDGDASGRLLAAIVAGERTP